MHQQNLPRASVDQACPQRSLLQICQSQRLHLFLVVTHGASFGGYGAHCFLLTVLTIQCRRRILQFADLEDGVVLRLWNQTQSENGTHALDWENGKIAECGPELMLDQHVLASQRLVLSCLPPWMELSWINRPLQTEKADRHVTEHVTGGHLGRFSLGPQNTASSSTFGSLKHWRCWHCCACGTSK